MFVLQPRNDLEPLMDTLNEYKGVLGQFPDVLKVHEVRTVCVGLIIRGQELFYVLSLSSDFRWKISEYSLHLNKVFGVKSDLKCGCKFTFCVQAFSKRVPRSLSQKDLCI